MYYAPLIVEGFEFDALVDTGACLSAMPMSTFNRILESSPSNMLLCRDKPSFDIQAANGKSCPVLFKTIIAFSICGHQFQEEFLVLPEMNTPLLGLPFFKYNGINILTSTRMLQLPNMTVQLNSMLKPLQNPNHQKSRSCYKNRNLLTKTEVTLRPFTMEIIDCEPEGEWKHQEITGVVEPSKRLETSLNLCLTNVLFRKVQLRWE